MTLNSLPWTTHGDADAEDFVSGSGGGWCWWNAGDSFTLLWDDASRWWGVSIPDVDVGAPGKKCRFITLQCFTNSTTTGKDVVEVCLEVGGGPVCFDKLRSRFTIDQGDTPGPHDRKVITESDPTTNAVTFHANVSGD